MKLNVKAANLELSPRLREYLENRLYSLKKLIEEHSDEAVANVEVAYLTHHHRHGRVFKAEINLCFSGREFYASELAEDFYQAIDLVKDEMGRQLRSDRKKKIVLIRRGGRLIKNFLRRGFQRLRRKKPL